MLENMDVIVSQECICLTTLIAFFVLLALAPENKAEWIGRTQNSSHLRSDYVTHGALDTPLPDTLWHNRTTLRGHLNCVLSAVLRSHIFIFGTTLTVTYYDETWTALGWKSRSSLVLEHYQILLKLRIIVCHLEDKRFGKYIECMRTA